MSELGKIQFSVSYTTRSPRGHEVDGQDYHFVTRESFDDKIEKGDFWRGRRSRKTTELGAPQPKLRLTQGYDVFFDIDYQGGFQIRERMNDAILIFIVPPDLAVLESRLRGRQTDSEEQSSSVWPRAREEVAEAKSYDYWICNDDLERASELLKSILSQSGITCQSPNLLMVGLVPLNKSIEQLRATFSGFSHGFSIIRGIE